MKNKSMFTGVSLVSILIITCFTCTYFDPSAAAGVSPSFFWINYIGQIFRSPLDDPNEINLVLDRPTESIPTCLKIDPLGGFIYWGLDDMGAGSIHRVNFDGEKEELIIETDSYIKSMAIDPVNQTIYFTEGPAVKMVSLKEKKEPQTMFEHPIGYEIADITLDFPRKRILITDYSTTYFWTDMYDPGTGQGNEYFLYNAEKIVVDNFNDYYFYTSMDAMYSIIREKIFSDNTSLTIYSSGSIVDFAVDTHNGFVYCAEQFAVYRIPVNGGSSEMIIEPSMNVEIAQFAVDFIQ